MTVVALVRTPLRSVDRRAKGNVLGEAAGNIGGIPLAITLTESEIHIDWADRSGPRFVIELNPLVKAAVDEIEILVGQRKDISG